MHTTIAQNKAHRNDATWIKSSGKYHAVNGTTYGSEYVNVFTGRTIRKGFGMTGLDWFIFDSNDNIIGRSFSLTYAKLEAGE